MGRAGRGYVTVTGRVIDGVEVTTTLRRESSPADEEYEDRVVGNANAWRIPDPWPEWGTQQDRDIHTAIENEIKMALAHCYSSADASGYDWTMEGLFSCAASSIMGMLKRHGNLPPFVGREIAKIPMPEGLGYCPEDDGLVECPSCEGSGYVEPEA